jgi:hypothetical protein
MNSYDLNINNMAQPCNSHHTLRSSESEDDLILDMHKPNGSAARHQSYFDLVNEYAQSESQRYVVAVVL